MVHLKSPWCMQCRIENTRFYQQTILLTPHVLNDGQPPTAATTCLTGSRLFPIHGHSNCFLMSSTLFPIRGDSNCCIMGSNPYAWRFKLLHHGQCLLWRLRLVPYLGQMGTMQSDKLLLLHYKINLHKIVFLFYYYC